MNKSHLLLLLLTSCSYHFLWSQSDNWLSRLEKNIAEKQIQEASTTLTQQITHYTSLKNYDSLSYYPPYVGQVELAKSNADQAAELSLKFVDDLRSATTDPRILRQTYLELSSFFETIGKNQQAFDQNKEALVYTKKWTEATGEDFGLIYSNMGVYARKLGDLKLSSTYFHTALNKYLSYPETKKESLHIIYNSLGGSMWFASKLDSARYFYQKALTILDEMEETPKNKYYRPAILSNNISAILSMEGKATEGLEMMKSCVRNLQKYAPTIENGIEKQKVREFLFQALDNLGGIYKELGDLKKGYELLLYSYGLKQKELPEDSPELFKSLVILGQTELYLREFDIAGEHLDEAIERIEKAPGSYSFWNADAYRYRGAVYEGQRNFEKAVPYYKTAEQLFEESYQGDYDESFLGFLIDASMLYIKVGEAKKALELAQKGYDFSREHLGKNALVSFHQGENLADVYFQMGYYEEALKLSEESLSILGTKELKRNYLIDSILVEKRKPSALYLKTRANYFLAEKKDLSFLKNTFKELEEALKVLEKQKSLVTTEDDVRILNSNHEDLFDFAKEISFELFEQTQESKYLDLLMSQHESTLYNRIRSRLNQEGKITFSGIPTEIVNQEKNLKADINAALGEGGFEEETKRIKAFFSATEAWSEYLENLREEHPKYYNLRFGKIVIPLEKIQEQIPSKTTVVRYFFIRKKLYALLLDKDKKKIFPLNYRESDPLIAELSNFPLEIEKASQIMTELYQALWAPFAQEIETEKVIIIPDFDLFNLSFELLTPEKINSFQELSEKSLLAKHSISYNYSLLLVQPAQKAAIFEENYIAFAPGFLDEMKQSYKSRITDSLSQDNTYLRMLPQPFILDLTRLMRSKAGGKTFLLDESTKSSFRSFANGHKIIHIGTHAESDNLRPELSRLVFAKNPALKSVEEDNYLHAYEIYGYNLKSNLALLTACETGKPGYRPGEGMISIAHAFNYAGSESILTALWKIDEKASAEITESFYQNLVQGLDKDEALKQAKLSYLSAASGRTQSPEYWAGLVIMGDSTKINIKEPLSPWYLYIGVLLLALAILYFVKKSQK